MEQLWTISRLRGIVLHGQVLVKMMTIYELSFRTNAAYYIDRIKVARDVLHNTISSFLSKFLLRMLVNELGTIVVIRLYVVSVINKI